MATVTSAEAGQHRTLGAAAMAVLLAAHGLAHFAGTSDSFDRASTEEAVKYVAGWWTISSPTALRLLGVIWAIAGTGLILCAVMVWRRWRHARLGVLAAVLVSLALCVVGLWAAVIGAVVDVAVLGVAAFAPDKAGLR